jgi:hypothetical protein
MAPLKAPFLLHKTVKSSLCLTKHYVMKTYGREEVQIHVFVTSTLVGGKWSASRTEKTAPVTFWIGGWVGLKVWTPWRKENS